MPRCIGSREWSKPVRIRSTSPVGSVRFASEDVGNADPQALTVAVAAKDAVRFIGMPEGNTALAQAAIYLATAPKSNAVYEAYSRAAADAHPRRGPAVPLHLRNAPTKLMKDLGCGKGYQYAHDEPDGIAGMILFTAGARRPPLLRADGQGTRKEIARRMRLADQLRRGEKREALGQWPSSELGSGHLGGRDGDGFRADR